MTSQEERDIVERITAAEARATKGPWKWWTSNSWRRLKRDERGITQTVIEPYVCRDGHPNLTIEEGDMEFIALAREAVPVLLKERQEAAGTIERLREALTFYRDQWFQNAEGDGSTPGLLRTWQEPTGALWDDAGAKARQALDPRP